ncbi:MAG TPA: OmpA family protein [Bacteroidia bacterium]|nr:OmpA family protein [Bacteroidia bacterium]
MKKLLLLVAIIFVEVYTAGAQKYATCQMAADVSSESFGPIAPNGAKDKNVAKHHSHGLYFEEEHNITWITFEIPNDTILTFELIPQKPHDDIDFLLFKDDEDFPEVFCNKIAEHKIKPIRTNLAKPDSITHLGNTGLSLTATDTVVPLGYNPCFSKALKVKKGERYYLVVDNYTEAKGEFILDLHLKFPKFVPVQTEERNKIKNIDAAPYKAPRILVPGKTTINIVVTDSSGNPVKSELDITGVKQGEVINVDTTTYSLVLNPRQSININCNSLGYMFTHVNYFSPDTASSVTLPIMLSRVEEHKSFILKNIKFQEGVAIFTASSQNELMNLLEFMRNNPDVNILIKGYVNDPGSDNSGAAKKLSKQRAEAVYQFLEAAGISKKRMDFRGFGNEHMIYPKPINATQEEANRRVEVEIMK